MRVTCCTGRELWLEALVGAETLTCWGFDGVVALDGLACYTGADFWGAAFRGVDFCGDAF